MAVNRSGAMPEALFMAIRQLVLAGLPTTSTRTSAAARAASARPCTVNMAPLASSRSLRSMPLVRGLEPTSKAIWTPSKASSGSSLSTICASSPKAQSSSSIATPLRASMAGGISSICSTTGWSGPSIDPEAIRNSRL